MRYPHRPADYKEACDIIEAQWRQIGELSMMIADFLRGDLSRTQLNKALSNHGDIDAENDARRRTERKAKK